MLYQTEKIFGTFSANFTKILKYINTVITRRKEVLPVPIW